MQWPSWPAWLSAFLPAPREVPIPVIPALTLLPAMLLFPILRAPVSFSTKSGMPSLWKVVIAAADKVAAEYKDQANKPIEVYVVFQPGNAMGEAEKKPIVIKTYKFTPVD